MVFLALAAGAGIAGYFVYSGPDPYGPVDGGRGRTRIARLLKGADACREAGLLKEAREKLAEVLAIVPGHAQAKRMLSKIQEEAARNEAEASRAATYKRWMDKGFDLRFDGRFEEAAEAYTAARRYAPPRSTEARDAAATCRHKLFNIQASTADARGDLEEAIALYKRALKERENEETRRLLTAAVTRLKDKKRRDAEAREVARLLNHARNVEDQGALKAALGYYRKAAESGADVGAKIAQLDQEVRYNDAMARARMLATRESWEEAVQVLEGVLQVRTGDAAAVSLLAEVKKQIGPPKEMVIDLGGGTTMEFVYVKPGRFAMGWKSGYGDERPVHEVTLTKGFYLGRYEVTRRQFDAFTRATGYRTEAEKEGWSYAWAGSSWAEMKGVSWRSPGFPQEGDHPAVCLSWNDAVAFCEWVSKKGGRPCRLPSEAEWEYACRAGTRGAYCWGSDPDDGVGWCNAGDQSAKVHFKDLEAFTWSDGHIHTAVVGRHDPNAWGLYDMHGNAREWCADLYDSLYYRRSPREDPTGPELGHYRAHRGGSWIEGPYDCRSSSRGRREPTRRYSNIGLRVASDPVDPEAAVRQAHDDRVPSAPKDEAAADPPEPAVQADGPPAP